MGPDKFMSLRKTHNVLDQGKELPKSYYNFLVDVAKLQGIIKFLTETLNVKPGMTRTLSLLRHKSKHLSVYERGGISVESMFK